MDKVTLNEKSLKEWQSKDLEHLRYEYDLKMTDKVIDIGSYRQEWADKIRDIYGCHVECFEALDNRAAWVYDGEIALGGAFYYSSEFGDGPKTTYKCVDIAPYLQEEIALVKINIEGSEYNLIKYIIDKGLIKKIDELQVQFHLIEGVDCIMFYSLLALELSKTHELTWQYPFCWENWRRKVK